MGLFYIIYIYIHLCNHFLLLVVQASEMSDIWEQIEVIITW